MLLNFRELYNVSLLSNQKLCDIQDWYILVKIRCENTKWILKNPLKNEDILEATGMFEVIYLIALQLALNKFFFFFFSCCFQQLVLLLH